METRPIDPEYPDGQLMAMDELVLHAAPEAPARSLLKAMEHCANAGIWRLRLTGEWPGGDVGIEVPLPVDLGTEILAAIEEEEDVAAAYAEVTDAKLVRKVEVTLRVIVEGRKLDPVNGGPWNGNGPRFVYDDSRRIEYSVGSVKTRDLQVVRDQLEATLEEWPGAHAPIDTRRGTVYEDVIKVLDLIMAVGFDQITFVGSYE